MKYISPKNIPNSQDVSKQETSKQSDFAIPVVNHIKSLDKNPVRSYGGRLLGTYWEPSSELEWVVSGILGGGIGNLITWEILLENLVENDWKPYQETCQQPCWEPQIRNAFTNSELNGSFSRLFCWELYQEPYRLFGNHIAKPIGNLSTTSAPKPRIRTLLGTLNIEPYISTLSETLSETLKPLFGTLLGT